MFNFSLSFVADEGFDHFQELIAALLEEATFPSKFVSEIILLILLRCLSFVCEHFLKFGNYYLDYFKI